MTDKKIIMVGGRRTGKSSILASMMNQLSTNTELTTKYIQMHPCRNNGDNTAESLDNKLNRLKSFIESNVPGRHYLVDFLADDKFNLYNIKCRIPKPGGGLFWGNIELQFVDCPGESFEMNSFLYNDLTKHFSTADVFIIVIDTPYLMDAKSDSGKFNQVNQCTSILSLFQQYTSFKEVWSSKKVIFVPVKCEAWQSDKDLQSIVTKLQTKEYYGPLFDYLKEDPRWSVSIIPAFTAGAIKFSEFVEPLLVVQTQEECSKLGNAPMYRLKDGTSQALKPTEVVVNSVFKTHFPFYSWFLNSSNNYSPKNCDQLALHIWRWVIYQTAIDGKHGIIPIFLKGLPPIGALKKHVKLMMDGGLLKDSQNGIKNINIIEDRI